VSPHASGIISLVSNNFQEASTAIDGELANFGQQMIGQI
jgi:hypothetical protein